MGKIKEHLDSYMHVYDNGTTARLYATPWDRNTVADGYWQTVNTIQPLINRDVYLADAIEELSAKANKYEPGSGITFEDLGNGTTKINASMAFALRGSNGIAIADNEIYLCGGDINGSFKLQNVSANKMSSYSAGFDTVSAENFTANNFTASTGEFTNLTAMNMTSMNANITNMSANLVSVTSLSAQNMSAYDISARNVSGLYISAYNLSANTLSSYSIKAANSVNTKTLSVTGGHNALNVSGDFYVYAGGTSKESLSAKLADLSTKITNIGKCYSQFGPNYENTDLDYYTHNMYGTNQSELIGQYYFKNYGYSLLEGCSMNYNLTSAVKKGVTDFTIRCGPTYSYAKLYNETVKDNWFKVGKCISFDVEAFKPYITYNVKCVPLTYCNLFESFTGVSFYSNKIIKNFYIYNIQRTPLSDIIEDVTTTDGTPEGTQNEVYRQMCTFNNQRFDESNNLITTGFKEDIIVANNAYRNLIDCPSTGTVPSKELNCCVRINDERGVGSRLTIPLIGDSLFHEVNYCVNHKPEAANQFNVDWVELDGTTHYASAVDPADMPKMQSQLMQGVMGMTAKFPSNPDDVYKVENLREYYGNGQLTFNITTALDTQTDQITVFLYCLNDYTTSGT
jgi:hypothetical protein